MDESLRVIYKIQKEISTLSSIARLLEWDENTNMPSKAVSAKSEQIKLIQKMRRKKLVSTKLYSAMSTLKKKKLSSKDQIVLRELEKSVHKAKKIPKQLMIELSDASVLGLSAWKRARKKNDFKLFERELERIVKLKRKQAKLLNPKLKPYDSLISLYEEGMDSEKLTVIFDELKLGLVKILGKIKDSKKYKVQKSLKVKMTIEDQKLILNEIISDMGINQERVALGVSLHPFTIGISKDDVRITTRYVNPLESFFGAVHEAGHALYSLGLPTEYHDTFVFKSASMGLDESQSLFWENKIAKSEIFWKGFFNKYKSCMKNNISRKEFYEAVNSVKPSFIRVNADEVTYCLHIILRFEIERDLINGSLDVKDVRDEWNRKCKELLGITPKSDNEGVLQDIHWAGGDFGYFPSYAIGAIYSAQIYNTIKKKIPDFYSDVRSQYFEDILSWLRKKIHNKGKTALADDIVKAACGKRLDPKAFITYLEDKYSKIYGF